MGNYLFYQYVWNISSPMYSELEEGSDQIQYIRF